MKKRFRPSSTWARLSKAYRPRRGEKGAPEPETTGSKPYTENMDTKSIDEHETENGSAQSGDGAAGGSTDPLANLDAVVAERDRLVVERADLQDRLLRRQAEFDNFRRRAERERADVLEFANTESVRAMLPIVDDFERALKVET